MSSEYSRKDALVHKPLLNSESRDDLKQRLTGSYERPLFFKDNVLYFLLFFCCFVMIKLNPTSVTQSNRKAEQDLESVCVLVQSFMCHFCTVGG